jgi:hypothetical protein
MAAHLDGWVQKVGVRLELVDSVVGLLGESWLQRSGDVGRGGRRKGGGREKRQENELRRDRAIGEGGE